LNELAGVWFSLSCSLPTLASALKTISLVCFSDMQVVYQMLWGRVAKLKSLARNLCGELFALELRKCWCELCARSNAYVYL